MKAMASNINIKNFSIKFIDIMIGIVLGLGFQWWTSLHETWQFIAFAFVYLDIVDFWIDYGPALKHFPPKKEINVFLNVAICFSLFLYIYTTQSTIVYFLLAFVLFKFFDFLWLWSSNQEYRPTGFEKKYVRTWMRVNGVEIVLTLSLVLVAYLADISPLALLVTFILMRVVTRIFASHDYKKIYLAN